jgi:outer membrane protein TolC
MRKMLVLLLCGSLILLPVAGSTQTAPGATTPATPTAPAATAPAAPIMAAPGPESGRWIAEFSRQLPMTLEEARRLALEQNPSLENARRDLRLAELDLVRSKASYDPYLQADASYSDNRKPSSQTIFGSSSKSASVNVSSGIQTVTGGSMSVSFSNSRSETDSIFSTLNPSYSTDLSLSVRQPLLKNRFNDTRAMDLEQRQNDLERARLALESKTHEIASQVEDSYWGLVRSRLDLELKRNATALAERMNRITQTQVRAGVSPEVATLQTEASAASSRANQVRSENDYRKSQAALKILLNIADPDLWSLEIVPTDLPQSEPIPVDRQAVLEEALRNNFNLHQVRLNLANTRISLEETRNRTLPQLDFRGSVGISGLAGTDHPSDSIINTGFVVPNPLPPDQFPQPYIVERIVVPGQASAYDGNYLDALGNMLDGENLSWSAGVTFNMPIGNRSAQADLERALVSYDKQLSDYRDQERQAVLSIINVIYDLEAAERNLAAASEASRLQRKNMETEEKKYTLGLNTTYEVDQAEENYEEARSAEINAQIEYMKAKARLERARKGYVGGGGVSALSISLPAGISGGGGLPAGIDQSLIQQYSSMLPAGIDINQLRALMP